jgi:hypothetical protein
VSAIIIAGGAHVVVRLVSGEIIFASSARLVWAFVSSTGL